MERSAFLGGSAPAGRTPAARVPSCVPAAAFVPAPPPVRWTRPPAGVSPSGGSHPGGCATQPLEPAKAHWFDRLGAEGVGIGHRDAEKLAGSDEPGDLPPPVGQQLEQFGGAGGDVEEAGCRLAL